METIHLVGAQVGLYACGNCRSNAGLELAGAALDLSDLLLGQKLAGGIMGKLQGMEPLRFIG